MTFDGTAIQGIDPRTGTPVGDPVPPSTATQLDTALAEAAAAAPVLRHSGPEVRAGLLRALADRIDERAGELVPLATAETGIPAARLAGEVARTSGQLRLFATVLRDGGYLEVTLDSADPAATPPRPDLRRWLEPIGSVLVFAASNFPFAFSVLGGDTASALAAGCPVIVKAHGAHPGLSRAVTDLAREVVRELGLPAGVFATIFGEEAGVAALRDRRIRASGFTGSTAGGRYLFDVASNRPDPIPFYGELGSVNPAVVTPAAVAARGPRIAREFLGSVTLGAGQLCTKPGLLFLPVGHQLDGYLSTGLGEVDPAPLLNSRIRDQLASGLARLSSHAQVEPLAQGAAAPDEGAWASPVLLRTTAAAVAGDPELLTEEHFGPAALIVEYSDTRQLLAALRAVEGSLTATVHAEPDEDVDVAEILAVLSERVGRVIFNGWPTGVAVSWAMNHGGPWPSTTAAAHTSVGATAIRRWLRPVCYQSVPEALLPEALRSANPWRVPRRVDGRLTVD